MLVTSTHVLLGAAQCLRRTLGPVHAIFGAILIVLLPYYTRLSASVLSGLPGIALAVPSLGALALWHQRRSEIWLGLSAVAFSLSVGIRLFAGFLGPIMAIGLLLWDPQFLRSHLQRYAVEEPLEAQQANHRPERLPAVHVKRQGRENEQDSPRSVVTGILSGIAETRPTAFKVLSQRAEGLELIRMRGQNRTITK